MGLASGSTSIPESIRTESLEVEFGNYTMIKMEESSGFTVLFGGENSNPPDDGGKDKILGLQLSARLQNNGLKDKIFLGLELIARLQHRTRGLRHLTRIHGVDLTNETQDTYLYLFHSPLCQFPSHTNTPTFNSLSFIYHNLKNSLYISLTFSTKFILFHIFFLRFSFK